MSTGPVPVLWPTPTAQTGGDGQRADGFRRLLGPEVRRREAAPTASPASISSPAASPASRSVLPESSSDLPMIVGYGPSSPESFASFDPATSLWRTSQDSLWEEEWGQSLETWPPSGMTRNGRAFPRQPLVPRTSVTGSGSSLTGKETHHVPTPTASDHIERESTSSETLNFETNKSVSLDRWARYWPTPQADDNRDRGNLSMPAIQRRQRLGKQLNLSMVVSPDSGALNPTWVEWLMGFPLGWTDLGPSATRSSRKSSSGSAGASSKRKPK
jgi:hypothetical protein